MSEPGWNPTSEPELPQPQDLGPDALVPGVEGTSPFEDEDVDEPVGDNDEAAMQESGGEEEHDEAAESPRRPLAARLGPILLRGSAALAVGGVRLAARYPRAALAAGLSVLILGGVMALTPGGRSAPTNSIPSSGPSTKTADQDPKADKDRPEAGTKDKQQPPENLADAGKKTADTPKTDTSTNPAAAQTQPAPANVVAGAPAPAPPATELEQASNASPPPATAPAPSSDLVPLPAAESVELTAAEKSEPPLPPLGDELQNPAQAPPGKTDPAPPLPADLAEHHDPAPGQLPAPAPAPAIELAAAEIKPGTPPAPASTPAPAADPQHQPAPAPPAAAPAQASAPAPVPALAPGPALTPETAPPVEASATPQPDKPKADPPPPATSPAAVPPPATAPAPTANPGGANTPEPAPASPPATTTSPAPAPTPPAATPPALTPAAGALGALGAKLGAALSGVGKDKEKEKPKPAQGEQEPKAKPAEAAKPKVEQPAAPAPAPATAPGPAPPLDRGNAPEIPKPAPAPNPENGNMPEAPSPAPAPAPTSPPPLTPVPTTPLLAPEHDKPEEIAPPTSTQTQPQPPPPLGSEAGSDREPTPAPAQAPAPLKDDSGEERSPGNREAENLKREGWVPIRHSGGLKVRDVQREVPGLEDSAAVGNRRDAGFGFGSDPNAHADKDLSFDAETPPRRVRSSQRDNAGSGVALQVGDTGPRVGQPSGKVETLLHTVESGENFWTISRLYYNSGRYYRALWKANSSKVKVIDKLRVGTVIIIPPPEDLDPVLIDPPGQSAPAALAETPRPARPGTGAATAANRAGRPTGNASDGIPVRRSSRADLELNLPVSDPLTERAGERTSYPEDRLSARDRGRLRGRKISDALDAGIDADDSGPEIRSRRAIALPVHKVQPYDTLRSIARDRLGDSRRADEILDLNRDLIDDPSHLIVGQILELPEDARAPRPRSRR